MSMSIRLVLSQRMRMAMVAVGLVCAEATFAARPAGDLNGQVDLFPDAAIW